MGERQRQVGIYRGSTVMKLFLLQYPISSPGAIFRKRLIFRHTVLILRLQIMGSDRPHSSFLKRTLSTHRKWVVFFTGGCEKTLSSLVARARPQIVFSSTFFLGKSGRNFPVVRLEEKSCTDLLFFSSCLLLFFAFVHRIMQVFLLFLVSPVYFWEKSHEKKSENQKSLPRTWETLSGHRRDI